VQLIAPERAGRSGGSCERKTLIAFLHLGSVSTPVHPPGPRDSNVAGLEPRRTSLLHSVLRSSTTSAEPVATAAVHAHRQPRRRHQRRIPARA
jgi:hypothetical protein